METEDTKFKRYLVREFFWELEQHQPLPSSFAGVQQDAVEVLTFHGYHDMRVRVADAIFDVHLSWQKDVPPDIQKVENVAV
jgi:hypothetical protein